MFTNDCHHNMNLSILICYFTCLFISFVSIGNCHSDHLCQLNDLKYDFTECDSFGGRWRVSVPISPDKCTLKNDLAPSLKAPVRVNKCYTSCEGGQFFNMTSLLCQDCSPGYYSLGGGVIIDTFNNSHGQLPVGFHINTESTKHAPEPNKLCNGWYVDPTTNNLMATMHSTMNQGNQNVNELNGSGCISVVSYTVKIVKSGRLRFYYRYIVPDDISSLLFTFNYRLYANTDQDETLIDGDNINSNIRFPLPTLNQNFDSVQVTFNRPGLYVFSWKSIFIGNLRNILASKYGIASENIGHFENDFEDNSKNVNNAKPSEGNIFQKRLSQGLIVIKKIEVEGVAYASECTPCEPGTYASSFAMRQCRPCPIDTSNDAFGASSCRPCNPNTEYSTHGSTKCRKRPTCGVNDLYSIPVGHCDPESKKQKLEFKWIEPRICNDLNNVFPSNVEHFINCTPGIDGTMNQELMCDLGMERRNDNGHVYCQFCPKNYYRSEQMDKCHSCPPFTSPYYALSVFNWNHSLPSWSNLQTVSNDNSSTMISEDYFINNPSYLNAFFSRQCIRAEVDSMLDFDSDTDKSSPKSNFYQSDASVYSTNLDDCDVRITWQPFHDYIRTGASALLDSYLILSVNIPGFRATNGGEISFVFETHCADGDRCSLMFVETKFDDTDFQTIDSDSSMFTTRNRKLQQQQSMNVVIKEWTQSTNERSSFRYKVDRNISVNYSWVFKRTTNFQSYAKIYSLLVTNSLIGSAIKCKNCPFQSHDTPNRCVTCPEGKYLDVNSKYSNESLMNHSIPLTSDNYQCKRCPPNHILNISVSLPIGIHSCIHCGPNLITQPLINSTMHSSTSDICFSNCSVQFGEDHYDLRELKQPLEYYGENLFTSTGTQYLHLIKISLCGHPKQTPLSKCANNITLPNEVSRSNMGVRSYICRNTIVPDEDQTFASQPISLGDELLGISRNSTFMNITVHKDFLDDQSKSYKGDIDYHLFYLTNTPTSSCPNGRRMTITMRCNPEVEKTSPGKVRISTPKLCPDGTCDGCQFHLLIESGTAAACRLCRPYSNDYKTLLGECIDGWQKVHFISPNSCVVPKQWNSMNGQKNADFITQRCTVLLPREIQIGIAVVCALGLLLVLLVFHFWNQNRSLEYKYSKLIENTNDGKGDDMLDNCCAETQDDLPSDNASEANSFSSASSQHLFSTSDFDAMRNISKDNRNNHHTKKSANNRIHNKSRYANENNGKELGTSQEMQQLFSDPSEQIVIVQKNIDAEGYETIHLTSANEQNQVA